MAFYEGKIEAPGYGGRIIMAEEPSLYMIGDVSCKHILWVKETYCSNGHILHHYESNPYDGTEYAGSDVQCNNCKRRLEDNAKKYHCPKCLEDYCFMCK